MFVILCEIIRVGNVGKKLRNGSFYCVKTLLMILITLQRCVVCAVAQVVVEGTDGPWLEEKSIRTWLSSGISWGMLQQGPGHFFIFGVPCLPNSCIPWDLELITLPPALILEQSRFPTALCSGVWVSQGCSWVLSQALQISWGLAKENEQCELSPGVAFLKLLFAMNRKSDKLGGKLPSA